VADAKAFRLSRTAKNQKDFKVQALDGWRGTHGYSMVVAPIYQLPARTSQIYQQAIARNVCILSYSHLAALVTLAKHRGGKQGQSGLRGVLDAVLRLHPTKSSIDYWTGVNHALLAGLQAEANIWKNEKIASVEALAMAKEDALEHLRAERNRLLGLSHKQALNELLRLCGIDSRIKKVTSINHGELLGL
jgi:type II restriction enzyme